MRRRWEYWVLMMAMHKLGEIPIPSTNQLKAKDIEYRVKAAGWDVKLLDERGRVITEANTVGEICVNVKDGKPLGLFQGYHKNEKQTNAVYRDGIYHTGELLNRLKVQLDSGKTSKKTFALRTRFC